MAITEDSNDPLAPKSDGANAFSGPIACVTLVSRNIDKAKQLYGDVLEMEQMTLTANNTEEKGQQRKLWGLEDNFDWEETVFHRPKLTGSTLLRILASDQAKETVRPNMLGHVEGGLSVGFASSDLEERVACANGMGFETTAGIARMDMKRTDGSEYEALECHFRAPDDVYALCVGRPADLAPVGPIEEGKTVGGPSYTGQVINNSDQCMRFYTEVLGYEVRNITKGISGELPEEALFVPKGASFDFLQVFAPGSRTGYFIVLDFGDAGMPNDKVSPPYSGVVMWTFEVKSIDDVVSGAARVGCTLVSEPLVTATPYFGKHKAVVVKTLNGFLVECIEKF